MAVLLVFLGFQVVDAVVSEAALQMVMDASSIDDASQVISTGSLGLGAATIGMKLQPLAKFKTWLINLLLLTHVSII